MRWQLKTTASLIVTAGVLSACTTTGDDWYVEVEAEAVLPPSEFVDGELPEVAADLFAGQCTNAGCHDAGTEAGGLRLDGADGFDRLVGVPADRDPDRLLVAPGDPAGSYLMARLRGEVLPVMPLGGAALDEATLAALDAWILSLANRNGDDEPDPTAGAGAIRVTFCNPHGLRGGQIVPWDTPGAATLALLLVVDGEELLATSGTCAPCATIGVGGTPPYDPPSGAGGTPPYDPQIGAGNHEVTLRAPSAAVSLEVSGTVAFEADRDAVLAPDFRDAASPNLFKLTIARDLGCEDVAFDDVDDALR